MKSQENKIYSLFPVYLLYGKIIKERQSAKEMFIVYQHMSNGLLADIPEQTLVATNPRF